MHPHFNLMSAALFVHVIGVALWLGGMFANALLAMRMGKATDWAERRAINAAVGTLELFEELPAIGLVALSGIVMIAKRPAGMEPWLHPKLTLVFLAAVATVVATMMNRGGVRAACEDQDEAALASARRRYLLVGGVVPLGLLGSVFMVAFFR